MTAKATNLFLLEDLDDVSRTRELAESDHALQAVARWIKGTRHSILTTLGQALPERVLRDFSRHRDARSLDRYSKPRATRGALVRAFPGPYVVPSAPMTDVAEANSPNNSGE